MLSQIEVLAAESNNDIHRKGVWKIKNDNIEASRMTSELLKYEDHCIWWKKNFNKEFIYIIEYKKKIIGYIRLTKEATISKNQYEISIALAKKFQLKGVGSYAYELFEKIMKKKKISQIIASTSTENRIAQKFFEKNGFLKDFIEGDYIRYIKKL